MEKHPNRYLNEFAALFVLNYLRHSGYKRTGTYINNAVWNLLENAEISPNTFPTDLSDLAHQAAIVQRRLVLEGRQNTSLRSVRHEYPQLMPVISHGPQAWLINTYRPLLEYLLEIDLGQLEYGIDKDRYRIIEENVMAARMMFENASKSIANELVATYANIPNLGLFGGGEGNGAAMHTNLLAFHQQNIFPDFLLSDIDPKTKKVAEKFFRERGYQSKHFPWMKIDIGNPNDLALVAKHFSWHKLIVNVNFIVHELEPIAEKFFKATSKSTPNADLVISEFFEPEDYSNIGPDFPHWFVLLHKLSRQSLRTEKDFMRYPTRYGYKLMDHRIDHQKYNSTPVTSTLFFTKK
ncbi:hypothetical protein A2572_03645 [Candidatus Collierbacteria bacterium RIFOXYD1_FULL_40_9]|uniref:Uncharacterized protein n=1 Tax=Candidatus Collierbacteria bacterium RIFOXYD1_FULL_40_9 TaxID=1817731 RepID=A0A1F5FTJ9_9BACT|nr:MAG: hypothetical protein A2572_03645 [Candidatus Collierbacteria bacterium RIFOXYD1_FULL_40_9]